MSADAQTAEAFLTKWNASALAQAVPGGLHSDRLVKPETRPYARLTCKQARKADASTGARYIDYREVEITVWGVGKAAMGTIVGAAQTVFDDKPLTVPGADFMRCEPILAQVDQEEKIKAGDDYRAGVLRWIVWTSRTR